MDGSEWVANFAKGWTKLCTVYELQNSLFLVIAGGECYIMSAESSTPIDEPCADCELAFQRETGRLVLIGGTDITVVEPNGEYWDSKRISWDGFKEVKMEGSIVSGLSWEPADGDGIWSPFSFDIDSRVLVGGSCWGE
ncbi:MAG: hypothetical protein JSS82_02900 [Bacteroidetes bacterium]|nr:hypothetical protein [Bacteroidota bacterium]